jgi:phage gpG-like protein
MPSKFGFDKILSNFERVKRELPPVIGNMGQRFFADSFVKGGFTDQSFQMWQPRKNEIHGGIAMISSKSKGARAVLVKSGALRNAVNRSVRSTTFDNISFEVGLKYAAVHNEGLHAGRGKGFKMPQRKFMGHSETLLKMIDNRVGQAMTGLHK